MSKFEAITNQLIQAVARLEEVLKMKTSDVIKDSAIQRFEFSLDLAWKTLKAFLEEKNGILVNSPKEAFREAFRQGLIEYEENWLTMVDLRNQTVHTYNQDLADKIYSRLPQFLPLFKSLLARLNP
ncbi:MAG: nucleotidyltransferase substrate binding protein [Patescibacteria group bacterium]